MKGCLIFPKINYQHFTKNIPDLELHFSSIICPHIVPKSVTDATVLGNYGSCSFDDLRYVCRAGRPRMQNLQDIGMKDIWCQTKEGEKQDIHETIRDFKILKTPVRTV